MITSLVAFSIGLNSQLKIPNNTFGSGWGVNIHFTREQPNEVKKIADAGFKWVRMNFYWGYTEETPGVYRFNAYDELMEDLDRHKIRPIFTLSFENQIYGSSSPRTPSQRVAFAKFAKASIEHFKGRGIVWELWNEPNWPMFWKPTPSVDEYIELIRAVGETFEQTAPNEILIGPSTSGFDWPYLNAIVATRAHEYFDAFTVHPYRQEYPETVLSDYQRLRQLLDRSGTKGKEMPIWCGEWGYSETYRNMNEEAQSWMAVRTYMTNLVAGVPLTIHYSWKNEMWQAKEEGRRFGTVDDKLEPKSSYRAMQKANTELGGYEYVNRIETGAHIFGLVFKKGDNYKIAAWSTTAVGTLRVGGQSFEVSGSPRFIEARPEWFGAKAKPKSQGWIDWRKSRGKRIRDKGKDRN
jgi:hypothetical protein